MLIEGFLQPMPWDPLTHILPERTALLLGEYQFMDIIFRKCVLLERCRVTQQGTSGR